MKNPYDITVSKNCIDPEMVNGRKDENFSRFPTQEWCAWVIPEMVFKVKFISEIQLS